MMGSFDAQRLMQSTHVAVTRQLALRTRSFEGRVRNVASSHFAPHPAPRPHLLSARYARPEETSSSPTELASLGRDDPAIVPSQEQQDHLLLALLLDFRVLFLNELTGCCYHVPVHYVPPLQSLLLPLPTPPPHFPLFFYLPQ